MMGAGGKLALNAILKSIFCADATCLRLDLELRGERAKSSALEPTMGTAHCMSCCISQRSFEENSMSPTHCYY